MFKAMLTDINLLRDSLDVISNFINEGTFTITNNGLSMSAIDPANIAMVLFDLLSSAFNEYKAVGSIKITINIPYFVSILKRAQAGDSVELELSDAGNSLKIKMIGDSVRTFTLPLINARDKKVEAPDKINDGFKTKVELEAGVLREGTKDSLMVSDNVLLKCDEKSFNMISIGDSSQVNLELTKGSSSLISLDCKKSVKAKYSLEYLDKMMKAGKLAQSIIMQFADDYPLRVDYKSIDKLRLSFILAPRIDTE